MFSVTLTGGGKSAQKGYNSSVAPIEQPSPDNPKDPMTLARLILEAVTDVKATLKADPHLRLMLRDLAASEDVDAETTALEVDGYISGMVASYLTNKRRKPRLRAPRVTVMSSANLKEGRARCVVRVCAWGHSQRFILDLEIIK